MKVYEALAAAFVKEGTTDVFGMMGDCNMHWMNALAKDGVNLYEARHEGCALSMADGWARSAGKPGVVTTTSGPGTSQLATTMIVASRAATPLVAFCGETALGDDEAVQRLDQARFAAGIECGFIHATKADAAFDVVQKAFYLARTESRPIMLSAPMNVQLQSFDDETDYVTSLELIGDYRVPPTAESINEATDVIAASENIVILVGRGARTGNLGDLVLQLQSATGAVISTSLQAKNWLRESTDYHVGISGLFGTKAAMEILQTADCVIAVGASLNKYTTEHGYLYPSAKYIQLDKKPHVVMGSGRRADCYIQADGELSLRALVDAVNKRSIKKVGFHTQATLDKLATSSYDPQEYDIEPDRVDPREAIVAIDDEVPTDIPFALGAGHQVDFSMLLLNRPRETLVNYGMFGAIGQGLILNIGACIARGNKPLVIIEGDAGFIMHLAEFETACRYNLPICVVVSNDECLGAEYHKAKSSGLDPDLAIISSPDLGRVAKELGGNGALVRTIDDLRIALKEFVANPMPTVIDVRTSRQVLSIPYRRLQYGLDV